VNCWQDCGVKNTCNVCWKHPPSVPECLSWQLKTCCIRGYIGTKHQLEFAKYIMQHSEVLETMKIQSTYPEKDQMLPKLSSCTRGYTACKLLFDWRRKLCHIFRRTCSGFSWIFFLGVISYTFTQRKNTNPCNLCSFYSIAWSSLVVNYMNVGKMYDKFWVLTDCLKFERNPSSYQNIYIWCIL